MARPHAAFFATLAIAVGGLASVATAQAAKDWSRVTAETAEGGMAIGNPAAPVKLVEYGSLTCSHCAHFSRDSKGSLLDGYVRSGKVRFEYRNFVLNGVDAAATLVARCGGPGKFFAIADDLYATQPQWIAKIQATPREEQAKLQGLPPGQLFPKIASLGGFQQVAAKHGVPIAKINQCLADEAAAQELVEMHNAGKSAGVTGTPTFTINGKRASGNTWAALEPELKAALAR